MNNSTLLAILECDEATKEWFRDAAREGWEGLDDIADAAMKVHGELSGLWRCDACDGCCLDVAVSAGCDVSEEAEAVLLVGDTILCHNCHEEAVEARKKIIVHTVRDGDHTAYEEDESRLTEEEQSLAAYLDRAESAANRQERELISGYPRDERAQLHRYADSNATDRFLSGKTVE